MAQNLNTIKISSIQVYKANIQLNSVLVRARDEIATKLTDWTYQPENTLESVLDFDSKLDIQSYIYNFKSLTFDRF